MSSSFVRPTLYYPSSKLKHLLNDPNTIKTLPAVVDFNAARNPNYTFCVQAEKVKTADGESTTRAVTISHREFRDGILRCQGWLLRTVAEMQLPITTISDGVTTKGPPVALLMESNVGLAIHILALMGLGVPVLILSTRLSPLAIQELLTTTGTRAVLTSPRLERVCREGVAGLDPASAPAVSIYGRQPYGAFLSTQEPLSARSICNAGHHTDETDLQVIILHSSGSTGLPKAIPQSHEYFVGHAACYDLTPSEAEGLNVSTLPLYHGFGILAMCLSLSVGLTMCLPVNSVSSAEALVDLFTLLKNARSMMTVPSVLDDLAQMETDAGIQTLQKLQFVAVGGGPLSPPVGTKLAAAGVPLLNHIGATEVGALSPIFVPKPAQGDKYDYRYFRLRQDFDIDVLDTEGGRCRLVGHPFGLGAPFPIQDQLVRSADNPETDFLVVGRDDDVIVLATGEKVLPGLLEAAIAQDEECKVGVMFGRGQFEAGVLVEPRRPIESGDRKGGERFRDHVWEIVKTVNEKLDAHARLSSPKSIIIVTTPGKAIPRSSKDSVLRQEAWRVFESEIEAMYQELDGYALSSTPGVDTPSMINLDADLEGGLRDLVQNNIGWRIPVGQWADDDDFFELGMDSLQALELRRLIATAIKSTTTKQISRDFVYRHPSILKLSNAIRGGDAAANTTSASEMDRFIAKYAASKPPADAGHVILLTGSTGSLGTHLVQHLSSLPSVSRIICVVRKPSSPTTTTTVSPKDQLNATFSARHMSLPPEIWTAKIDVLQADFSKPAPFLGLVEPHHYDNLRRTVTHIIHNGWPMDFNRHVSSFESQFQLTRGLLHLAHDIHTYHHHHHHSNLSAKPPVFMFISSIAVAANYSSEPQSAGACMVPEIPMPSSRCPLPIGYAQAKYVCERIIEDFAAVHGGDGGEVVTKYVRVGQMTGARGSGMWNTSEHFPALTLSWLPVDIAAASLTDLLFHTPSPSPSPFPSTTPLSQSTPEIYHLENPLRQSWDDILTALETNPTLASKFSPTNTPGPTRLPYETWLERMLAAPDDGDRNPAKKMAGFFQKEFEHMAQGKVVLGTEEARRCSPALRAVGIVDAGLVGRYVDAWRAVGFLD
ncbi:putative NRPS-like enzyme [Cercophora scortea]|uniref:NRPS-like enzyme n=1 Tax=Cercophora scortea TaxID=314031 RepID=A0AAE0MMB1_9PEZI|nr:putative NRPS-like enzyme [Cercophora scortea]